MSTTTASELAFEYRGLVPGCVRTETERRRQALQALKLSAVGVLAWLWTLRSRAWRAAATASLARHWPRRQRERDSLKFSAAHSWLMDSPRMCPRCSRSLEREWPNVLQVALQMPSGCARPRERGGIAQRQHHSAGSAVAGGKLNAGCGHVGVGSLRLGDRDALYGTDIGFVAKFDRAILNHDVSPHERVGRLKVSLGGYPEDDPI